MPHPYLQAAVWLSAGLLNALFAWESIIAGEPRWRLAIKAGTAVALFGFGLRKLLSV